MLDLEHLKPRWPPLTQSARSRRCQEKIGDGEHSKTHNARQPEVDLLNSWEVVLLIV